MHELAHVIRPSSLHRILACPGGVAMAKNSTTAAEGKYATIGTKQHEQAAEILRSGSPERPPELRHYLDYVHQAAENGEVFIEEPVPVSAFCGESGAETGTPDAAILGEDFIEIIDRKMPFGHPVTAERNPQLAAYALGLYQQAWADPLYDPEFFLTILQGESQDTWRLDLDELLEFAESTRERVAQAAEISSPSPGDLIPGKSQCRYCPASAHCPALRAATEISEMETPPAEFTAEALAEALSKIPLMKIRIEAIESAAYARAVAGEALPGFKLVAGRGGPRKWADEAAAEAQLKAWRWKSGIIYKEVLRTPADLEKSAPPELLQERARGTGGTKGEVLVKLTSRSAGKPALVAESDPRHPYDAASFFDELVG